MRVVTVARKPLSEGTVAANVLEHGCGAINIDGCRIGFASDTDKGSAKPQGRATAKVGALAGKVQNEVERTEWMSIQPDAGRWPANLILIHRAGCRQTGTRMVKGSSCKAEHVGQGRDGDFTNGIYGAKASKVTTAYVGADGQEEVAAWECVEGCPVIAMDAKTGEVRAGHYPSESTRSDNYIYGNRAGQQGPLYADKGGASRFFKQVSGAGR